MAIEVSTNGRDYTSDDVQYEALTLVLKSVTPWSGPQLGGTDVILFGGSFAVGGLECVFGDAPAVPASITSASKIHCTSPAHPTSGWVDLSSLSYSTPLVAAVSFYYTSALHEDLTDPISGDPIPPISPKSGPTIGGTIVTVSGSAFFENPDAMCRFGERGNEVFARYTSVGTFECTAPVHAVGEVNVEVSLNGQQFSTSIGRIYTYREPLVLHAISPYQGPITGKISVYITGNTFPIPEAADTSLCRFRGITSPATLLTPTSLKCEAPAIAAGGYIAVEVSTNLQDWTSSGLQLLFVAVTIDYVHPSHASQLGGTEVTVNGNNFMPPTEGRMWCMFGTSGPALATWESPRRLRCTTPHTHHIGATTLYVFANSTGNSYTSTALIVFLARPRVLALRPTVGPTRGGTVLTIHGTALPLALSSRCFFGSIATLPRMLTSTAFECVTPSVPSDAPRVVQASINQDAKQGMPFYYYEDVQVHAVHPKKGAVAGGTQVEVRGKHFDANLTRFNGSIGDGNISVWCGLSICYWCAFNRTAVVATRISDRVLVCVAPKHTASFVELEVSIDGGFSYSASGIHFEFMRTCLLSITPQHGPVLGDTIVVLGGRHILPPCLSCPYVDASMWCRFGDVASVEAQYDSASQVRCRTPPAAAAGSVHVQLVSARAVVLDGLAFLFTPTPVAGHVSPLVVHTSGGTLIRINGRNFAGTHAGGSAAGVMCYFGEDKAVVSRVVSDRIVECVTPLLARGYHSVMLSLNGQNCFDDGLRVEAIARADLNGIVPKVGFVGGGQQVRVWASGLHRRSAELGYTHCRFGDSSVPATMESEETLVCTTPAHPSGIFTLEVTQNDQQHGA
jgi:hypothetical protein